MAPTRTIIAKTPTHRTGNHNHFLFITLQEEAKLAYQKCLFAVNNQTDSYDFNKFQQTALTHLIQIYCQENRPQLALLCSLRLINCQENVYVSVLHPTQMSTSLCGLVGRIGLKKVQSDLRAIKGQQGTGEAWTRLDSLLESLKQSKIHGFDY